MTNIVTMFLLASQASSNRDITEQMADDAMVEEAKPDGENDSMESTNKRKHKGKKRQPEEGKTLIFHPVIPSRV